ncbi:MAG: head GIN domain-containing protein [Bacteroidales bacterium]
MKTIRIFFITALLFSLTSVYAGHGRAAVDVSVQDKEKEIPISGVRGLDLSIACELNLRQGDKESLRIEADEDIFDKLDVKVKDSVLYIGSKGRNKNFEKWDVEVYLTLKTLEKIDIGSAVKLRTHGTIISNRIDLSVSGAADIELSVDTEKFLADFSGAVKADIAGKASYVVMDMSGASKVDAEDLVTDAFYLDFSGFGKADIYAEKVLKVDMSGMGVVRYGGNPKKVDANSSGLGVIRER